MDIQVIPRRHKIPRQMIKELYEAHNLTANDESIERWLCFYYEYGMTDLINSLNKWLDMSSYSLRELDRMEKSSGFLSLTGLASSSDGV